jgi:hypothetical protein
MIQQQNYISIHSSLRHYKETRGEQQAPVYLPQGKDPRYIFSRSLGGLQGGMGIFENKTLIASVVN